MAEQPPLSRIHVVGYSANDRDFPLLAQVLDPRVAGYRVPEDLSACPDKRYPNHVFTGAQPISGDQRVRHVWEILPSPYVPFTRYDDDLGPVQGRRRSVKNEGQVASREADKQVTYDARDGSAIVYTELEETWSIKTDEDGNSLFPIRDRDFYDASRGPVQERRQLFVPTGEEEGSLENVNGVITQTSYEPYNDFLSVKIVQTYKVDGPQLIGKATDNEGQLVTVTTQRKAADGYVPPNPTATRTVEANREDAESVVERIVDTPQVFGAEVFRKTREDLTPQKFKAAQEDSTVEQNVEGTASSAITLATGEFAKSEQQINKFVKRVSTTSRSTTVNPDPLVESVLTNEGQLGTRTLTLASGPQTITPSATMVDANVEALGDGRTVKTEVVVPNVFSGKTVQKSRIDLTPEKFKAAQEDTTTEESVAGTVDPSISLGTGEFRKSEQQVTEFVKRVSSTTRDITASRDLEEVVITPQGQVATRTLRLSAEAQSIQPDALLIDGSIEELGDGRTIKTEVKVPKVFDAKTLSSSKPDVIPEQFRASAPAETTQETVAQDSVAMPSLGANDLEKSEQRVTEFTVRKTTTSRDNGSLPVLQGQDYEPEINAIIKYSEQVTESGAKIGSPATIVNPLSDEFDFVQEFDLEAIEEELNSIFLAFPTRTSLTLPPTISDATVIWGDIGKEDGSYISSGSAPLVAGSNGRSISETASASCGASVKPDISYRLEQIWANNIPTTSYIFFIKYPLTLQDITTRISQTIRSPIFEWPVFKPVGGVIVCKGQSKSARVTASASHSMSKVRDVNGGAGQGGATTYAISKSSGDGFSGSINDSTTTVVIPPCLGSVTFNDRNSSTGKADIQFNWNGFQVPSPNKSHGVTATGSVKGSAGGGGSIPRTGLYLIDSRVELYKYGFARVYAEVLDAGKLA